MATFFLLLIYLTFISLGLPDPLLGAAWPVMRTDLGAGLEAAGVISMIICAGTIVSSLASERMTARFGTGTVTAVSVLATAAALLGFGLTPSYWWLLALAVPLGLGAGAVDVALNNFVALHYQARHMSWLHSFWGVGAFAGPMIMAVWLQAEGGWRGGYLTIGTIQLAVSLLLLATLGLWKRYGGASGRILLSRESVRKDVPKLPPLRIPGVMFALLVFLLYCAVEYSAGLWSSSYLVEMRGFSKTWAARGTAGFYAGITVGRFLNGFLASRYPGRLLIRCGALVVLGGAVLIALPLSGTVAFTGLILVGLGCAPIFPCMIHETPRRFGGVNSPSVIGLQMAMAYSGSMLFPPLLGVAAGRFGLGIFPFALLFLGLLMLVFSEAITLAVNRDKAARSN